MPPHFTVPNGSQLLSCSYGTYTYVYSFPWVKPYFIGSSKNFDQDGIYNSAKSYESTNLAYIPRTLLKGTLVSEPAPPGSTDRISYCRLSVSK